MKTVSEDFNIYLNDKFRIEAKSDEIISAADDLAKKELREVIKEHPLDKDLYTALDSISTWFALAIDWGYVIQNENEYRFYAAKLNKKFKNHINDLWNSFTFWLKGLFWEPQQVCFSGEAVLEEVLNDVVGLQEYCPNFRKIVNNNSLEGVFLSPHEIDLLRPTDSYKYLSNRGSNGSKYPGIDHEGKDFRDSKKKKAPAFKKLKFWGFGLVMGVGFMLSAVIMLLFGFSFSPANIILSIGAALAAIPVFAGLSIVSVSAYKTIRDFGRNRVVANIISNGELSFKPNEVEGMSVLIFEKTKTS